MISIHNLRRSGSRMCLSATLMALLSWSGSIGAQTLADPLAGSALPPLTPLTPLTPLQAKHRIADLSEWLLQPASAEPIATLMLSSVPHLALHGLGMAARTGPAQPAAPAPDAAPAANPTNTAQTPAPSTPALIASIAEPPGTAAPLAAPVPSERQAPPSMAQGVSTTVGIGMSAVTAAMGAAGGVGHLIDLLRADSSRSISNVNWFADRITAAGRLLIGTPYLWGGVSERTGFDCSGLVQYVFGQTLGLRLPRTALEQAKSSRMMPVVKGDLQPGDLVFFNTRKAAFSHVGLYIGAGQFIHAPRSGAKVRIDEMNKAYWSGRYNGARRVVFH